MKAVVDYRISSHFEPLAAELVGFPGRPKAATFDALAVLLV